MAWGYVSDWEPPPKGPWLTEKLGLRAADLYRADGDEETVRDLEKRLDGNEWAHRRAQAADNYLKRYA